MRSACELAKTFKQIKTENAKIKQNCLTLLVMLMVVLKMLQMFRGGDGDWHVVRVQHHAAVTRAGHGHGSRGSSSAAATVTDAMAIAAGCGRRRGTLQRGWVLPDTRHQSGRHLGLRNVATQKKQMGKKEKKQILAMRNNLGETEGVDGVVVIHKMV